MVYNNEGEPIYLSISEGPKLKKLRHQIVISFQIYAQLLSDRKIKEFFDFNHSNLLLTEIKNKLFFNFEIEKIVRMNLNLYDSCDVRFNDLCLNLNINKTIYLNNVEPKLIQQKIMNGLNKNLTETQNDYLTNIIVEINEGHHIPVIDNLRKLNIYQETGKLSLDYSHVDTNFLHFYRQLLKEIGKIIYKNYGERDGIIFMLCCVDDFDISLAGYFCEIYYKTVVTNVGITVKEVIQVLKSLGNKSKLTEEKIMEELDNEISFVEINQEDFYESLLSNVGVDQLMLLPARKNFKKKPQLIQQYTNFREKVFNSILEFFNGDDESTYVCKLLNHINQMTQITENIIKPMFEVLLSKLNKETIGKIESKHNVNVNKVIPFLIKSASKYDQIDKNILLNLVNAKLVEDIRNKTEPGKPTIMNSKILSPNIVKDLLSNNI